VVKLDSGVRQTPPGPVEVQFTQPGFPWSLDLVEKFYSADEFIVRGLTTRNRESGLGAPANRPQPKNGTVSGAAAGSRHGFPPCVRRRARLERREIWRPRSNSIPRSTPHSLK